LAIEKVGISLEESVIETVEGLIQYLEGIRWRTLNYLRLIPSDKMDWSLKEDEFTCGDMLRHIIAVNWRFICH
jgi:hypothetical protein